jgi:RNA polymerase sigma factor (sigma-70 family)
MKEQRRIIAYALKKLKEIERRIIFMRYLQEMTLEEVSGRIGKTRERVRQIQKAALRKMKILLEDLDVKDLQDLLVIRS